MLIPIRPMNNTVPETLGRAADALGGLAAARTTYE